MFECDENLSADDGLLPAARQHLTTTDGHAWPVIAWASLAALDAGGWRSAAFAGERLSTLDAIAQATCLADGWLLNIGSNHPGTETHARA
jgi:glycerophosphoryl diester phosphodiesterase